MISHGAGIRLTSRFHALHAVRADDRGVLRLRLDAETIAGCEFDVFPAVFDSEGDRAADAVEHRVVGMAVGGVAVVRTVRPAVRGLAFAAACGEDVSPGHESRGLLAVGGPHA